MDFKDLIGLYILICVIYSMIKGIEMVDNDKIKLKLIDYILLPSIILSFLFVLYINTTNRKYD